MKPDDIFKKAISSNYVIIQEDQLQALLKSSKIIKEVDTHLSDFIRVLNFDNNIFIQEMTFKKEIIIRRINSSEDADKFINERLDSLK
jgi:hypothetical protein